MAWAMVCENIQYQKISENHQTPIHAATKKHTAVSTHPETNIYAPENRPLEKEIPIGNHHFLGLLLLVLGSVVMDFCFQFFRGDDQTTQIFG